MNKFSDVFEHLKNGDRRLALEEIDRCVKRSVEEKKEMLKATPLAQLRYVWNRGRVQLRVTEQHVSFSTLHEYLSPDDVSNFENLLKVAALLKKVAEAEFN